MRVIIAGSRSIEDYEYVKRCIEHAMGCGIDIKVVVQGEARGVDLLGKRWSIENGIPHEDYPAKWEVYGKYAAGSIRNQEMADVADALIAVWDGKSTGTADMIQRAHRKGIPVRLYVEMQVPSTVSKEHKAIYDKGVMLYDFMD